jgi:hypothetical protein
MTEEQHTIDLPLNYSCVICDLQIHSGGAGCSCSTYREGAFQYASLCMSCAKAFDRLMADPEILRIHQFLLAREFFKGAGPTNDTAC